MKKIDNVKFYDTKEIAQKFLKNKTENEIKQFFKGGKINGMKIEGEWHANKEAIDECIDLYMNERYFTVGPIEIDLSNIKMDGRILDIGGGGEGVIGQLKGQQVVAIDPSKRELEEAPKSKALNVIMDGKDLKFLDNAFDTATAFFTLMYVPLKEHRLIFDEIYRVLKKGGEFFLWDLIIPKRGENKEEGYVIALKVKINEDLIDTGYGTRWNKEQDAHFFLKMGKEVGFELLEKNIGKNSFFIKFKKI